MPTIGIVGGGNVGGNTALFLAERGFADVVVYDPLEGLPEGKALDLMEAAPISAYQTTVSGTGSIEDLFNTEIIMVTNGSVRTPGMERDDLFDANRPVIDEIAAKLTSYKGCVIVVSEPVDSLTTEFVRKSGLSSKKVMGLGGSLDSARLRYLIARELSMSAESISAIVIGSHSSDMVPLTAYCRVSGIPVATLLPENRLTALFDETKQSGDLIVELAKHTSAFYGPAAAASEIAEAIIRDTKRIISVSHMFSGQYGIEGVAMSLPAVIGKDGIERTLTPALDGGQKRVLAESAEAIKEATGQ